MVYSLCQIRELQRFYRITPRPLHVYPQQVQMLHIALCGQHCNIFGRYPLPDHSHQRPENGI